MARLILAPLRGVTIRCFREVFAEVIRATGFTEAVTPFIPAMPGLDPLRDRELRERVGCSRVELSDSDLQLQPLTSTKPILVTPQFIGKDPEALRRCLERIKSAGYATADLNCGCPYPMVRNKGRGSGLLRTPDTLRRMLEVGCEVMGEGRFSLKARLGVDRSDELLALMPIVNSFPLRLLTVHARTARQMYVGACDLDAYRRIQDVANVPLAYNGDVELSNLQTFELSTVMIGRSFIRTLGTRADVGDLLSRYLSASCEELCGERPVLGRMKELFAYWKDLPTWRRRWPLLKIARSLDELRSAANIR